MSGTQENPSTEVVELPFDGDTAFASIMDTLAPEADEPEVPAGGEAPGAPAAGDGSPAAPVQGAAGAAAGAAAPAAGAAGGAGVPAGAEAAANAGQAAGAGAAGAAGAGAGEPGAGAAGDNGSAQPAEPAGAAAGAANLVDADSLAPKWGEMLVGLETRQNGQLQQQAFSEVRQEYGRYFDALEQHPRSLVGTEVPSTKGEGTEILRDSKDAAEWQEEVKHLLTMEVKDRASRRADAVRPMMETLHAAVGIFQQNPDLIPKTKQFDKELADKFAELAKPYELRVDGKLVGYSIPVQPLVNQVRSQLAASRAAAAPAAPAAPSAQQQRAAEAPRNDIGQFHNPDAPQAGISSKAGNSSSDGEDFSTLFGTIGLPGLRI